MNLNAERAIFFMLSRCGTICKDPDWQNTFILPDQQFDELAESNPQSGYYLPISKEGNGYRFITCGVYKIRRENPICLSLHSLWNKMNGE